MSDEYDDILQRGWEDLPDEALLPTGTYRLKARNAKYMPSPEDGKSPKILVFFSVMEATSDVDGDALADLGDDYDLTENEVVHTIYIERQVDWKKRVKPFLEKLGVDATGNIVDALKAVKNKEIYGSLDQRSFTNRNGETETVNNITGFRAVD